MRVSGHPRDMFLSEHSHILTSGFEIDLETFRIEIAEDLDCNLESEDVVDRNRQLNWQ